MKWISVKDSLPNDKQVVLVYEPHCSDQPEKGITTDVYSGGDLDYGTWVTHWMPLPEPPENES